MDAAIEPHAAPPRRPARGPRLYFGWRVIAALFLCSTSLLGVAIYAFIMFAGPLADQFGWSAAQTGNLVSAMWLVGPLALVAAPAIERFGPWRMIVMAMLLEVVVLIAIGAVTAFWQLYLLRILMGVGKIALMTAAPVIIARWFERRFATAMAIVWAGGGAGGIVIAPLTQQLTAAMGWQSAALVLAAGLAACGLLAALIVRGPAFPADGELEFDTPAGGQGAVTLPAGWSATVRSMNWWLASLMCVSVVGAGLTSIALQSQEPAVFEQAGLSASTAAAMLAVTAAAALFGSIFAGWLLDRFNVIWTSLSFAAAFYLGLLAFAGLTQVPDIVLSVLAAAAAGYALGVGEVVWITLFKRQFGVAAFATTYGIFYFSIQVGFAAGGYVGGWGMDNLGLHGFLALCAATFLPTALFAIWRPGAATPVRALRQV